MNKNQSHQTPVIILGGAENALSIVRDFVQKSITTHVIARDDCITFKSRYCSNKHTIPQDVTSQQYFKTILLEHQKIEWRGSVVFACTDDAIEFVIEHRQQLDTLYKLDIQNVSLQKAMLDKKETLRLAKEAGLNIPAYWEVESLSDIGSIKEEAVFPVILKPVHSHVFQRTFHKKLMQIYNAEELEAKAKEVSDKGIKFMISEYIPGPDTLLSSFYTYLDHERKALFRFTKYVIRRYPVNFGGGSFHGVKWLPETAEEGEKFFRHIDFTGLANIEFKTDLRDNKLKVIECNARFTAAQELVTRSGVNMPYIIYCYLTGGQVPSINSYNENFCLWYFERDIDAFRQMHKAGELTLLGWIKSIITRRLVFPIFRWDDVWPACHNIYQYIIEKLKRSV